VPFAIAAHPAPLANAFHVAFWWPVGFPAVAVLLPRWLPGAARAQVTGGSGAPDQHEDAVKA
jgi:hypothetical protein